MIRSLFLPILLDFLAFYLWSYRKGRQLNFTKKYKYLRFVAKVNAYAL